MPPLPSAKDSTIFGGAIRHIDPVRDQFLLDIYGQHPMKVLFDERTQVYRDGVKIPVHDLRPADHASVQTTLDGTRIFALSVHILSSIPHGEYRGRVLSFNESTGELKLDAAPSPQALAVHVPETASIVRKGQPAFTQEGSGRGDLRPGALGGRHLCDRRRPLGVASRITVLAVPGSSFIFSGNISALDVGSGSLVLSILATRRATGCIFALRNPRMSAICESARWCASAASYNGTDYTASEIGRY